MMQCKCKEATLEILDPEAWKLASQLARRVGDWKPGSLLASWFGGWETGQAGPGRAAGSGCPGGAIGLKTEAVGPTRSLVAWNPRGCRLAAGSC